jgi:hypothetical protein
MHLERQVAVTLLAFAIAACNGAEISLPNAGAQPPASRMEPVNGSDFTEAASRAALIEGYEVVAADSNGRVAAVVLYRSGDTKADPSACVFSVVEASGNGMKVVDSSEAIIECPLDSSVKEARAATTLAVGSTSISVDKEATKGHEAFLLERGADGIWYVTKASYTRSEEDATTGDMMVFVEEATYPAISNGVALGKYSYEAIKKDLVERVVE